MEYSIVDDLPNILERFTKNYLKWRGISQPYYINSGECFVWAYVAYKFLKNRGVDVCLMSCVSHGGHAWIQIEDTAYDCANLEGVYTDDMVDNFIDGYEEDDEEVALYRMNERDFVNYWSVNGRHGTLLCDDGFLKTLYRSICQCGRNHKKVA